MPYLNANDTTLHYTDWGGDGPPVVLVHAWALSSAMWNYQLPALAAAGLRCVTYDRRGHGRSDVPGLAAYDYDALADDLAAVLEALDVRGATLVGYSAGAGDVVRYVSRHGAERVDRVALLAPTTPQLPPADPSALMADVPQWCADNAEAFFGTRPSSAGMRDWVTRMIVDTPLPVVLQTAMAFATTDFSDELRAFPRPALVIHGDQDASAPLEVTGAPTAELLPDAELRVYAGAGHGLFAADAARLNADLLEYVGRAAAVAAG
jgi:non-heme chloroperoxidase